ncbi:hypothetical protein [Treponema primitia]|uniref:hypothetical protein n=1 Tax=Treponema primitia TaxID=88058 RepID=UPI0002554EAE|nr:hypothetical protein [Treponema primitia]
MISVKDKGILQELAKKYMELAVKDVNKERIRRIKDMHSLKPVRPPVWIDEIPWHEMDIDGQLALHCESKEAREIECFFRRVLFRWKYFQVDMVVEDTLYITKAYTDSGIGISIQEETLSTSENNTIVSHHYEDQLDTEEKVEALHVPVIKAQPDLDRKNLELWTEVFDGIIPVALRGPGVYFYAPWDDIVMFRGIQPCLYDMADRPEFIHTTIRKFTEIGLSRFEQMEAEGLLDYNLSNLHCTPPYTDELPAKDYDGGKVRMKDIWFRGMAQIFSSASPAMQEEFDLQYMCTLMDKCAIVYYGCCEPLDRFIPYLKKIPNMRKIGCSPWSSVKSSAEQIGSDYVLARKPNPAFLGMGFNTEQIRQEITETVEVCRANKTPYELVLKDISTVNNKPQNLIDWADTAMAVIDKYYN